MIIDDCLKTATDSYLKELRIIKDMLEFREVEEDETLIMQKITFREYAKKVNNCYLTFEGRSTPGIN